MLRSLFAGVTGLANHQLKLDVIGNNIANINTLGFKASRVTFREMLTQTIRGASRPSDGIGGTNPQQIGLGSSIGSVDTDFSQGNMQITGIMTDLAIEGEGFFVLSDGFNQFYTRGGAFSMDGAGYMVNPGNGYKLQGIIADSYGNIQQGQGVEDIMIPTSLIVPARATREIAITGNLPATANPQGSILRTDEMFMAAASSGDLLLDLYTGARDSVGLVPGNVIEISADVGPITVTDNITVTATTTVAELVAMIQSVLRQEDPTASANLNADGTIDIAAGTDDIEGLNIAVQNNSQFNQSFLSNFNVSAGDIGTTNIPLRALAEETDLLTSIYVNNARLPIDEGDLTFGGIVGGTDISDRVETVDATTTLGDFLNWMESTYATNGGSVELNNVRQIVVTGDNGEAYSIDGIEISQDGANITELNFDEIQLASNGDIFDVTSIVYDSLGNTHNLMVSFAKLPGDENVWNWTATLDGIGQITGGSTGVARFTSGGLLSSFTTDGTTGMIEVDWANGSDPSTIMLDPGAVSSTSSLSQFTQGFSARMNDLDGMGMGTLQTISINRNGIINGQFSNGTNRDLAQIVMADFNNPSGLNRVGENMFIFSPNSGTANFVYAGTNARGMITPGELEMSNVDLAGEFTEMIIAQRGFQANARIISVGDQMLTELVNLKK